jgi:hypothetical protein
MADIIPLLRKGALVAQEPSSYEDISGSEALDNDEKVALKNEILYKWRVPMLLYLTIATCSIGAAVQGWDQTGSNGANLSFPAVFGIGDPQSERDTFLVGLINAAPYLGSCFIGCWLSDPLNFSFGRRGQMLLSLSCRFPPSVGLTFHPRFHLHRRAFLFLASHRRCLQSNMASALGVPIAHGHRYGGESQQCAYFRSGKLAGSNQRSVGYELADVDSIWHLPGYLC